MDAEAARWIKQAEEDFKTARALLDAKRYGPCAFYCQQTAEKAVKAVIYDAGQRPWGHSIPALLDQACHYLEIKPEDCPFAEATALDEHYMLPRYPDAVVSDEPNYDHETAAEAIEQAEIVLGFVREGLKHA